MNEQRQLRRWKYNSARTWPFHSSILDQLHDVKYHEAPLYTFLCHNCKRRISQFSSFVSNNYIIHPLYYCNRGGSMVQRIIILESDKNKTMNDCAKRSEQLFSIIAACGAEQYVWILTPDVINGIMMVVGNLHQSLLLLVIVILSYLSCLQILSLSHWWIF